MKHLPLVFWLVCALCHFCATSQTYAHGFAGARFFPATLSSDDPFVADELSLPTVSTIRTPDDGGTLRQMQSAMQSATAVFRSPRRRGIHSPAPRSFLKDSSTFSQTLPGSFRRSMLRRRGTDAGYMASVLTFLTVP